MRGCRHRQDLTLQYPCSFRFPLLAGGTEPVRSSPREAGGTCRRGAIHKLCLCDWYKYTSFMNSGSAIGITPSHPSHARGQPSHAAFTVDPRPAGTAHPARRYAGLSHAPRSSRVVSRGTGRGTVGASDATALPSAGGSAQDTASDGGACGRCAAGAGETRGVREALTAQGVRVGQRVVFVDALRVGLIGQVRRRWTVRGVRLCQRVERSSKWRYLQVAVDPLSGAVWQR